MVGFALLRTVPRPAPRRGRAAERLGDRALLARLRLRRRSADGAAIAQIAARTVGISRTGHWYAAILATAAAEPGHRVVGIRLRAVTGPAVRRELQPRGAALGRRDRVETQARSRHGR